MREKHINEDFSGQSFTDLKGKAKKFTGYYKNCNFSSADFKGVWFNCVAYNCTFDGADFRNADIYRLWSPGSTFVDAKFGHNFLHTAYHTLLGKFNTAHNHQIIAEILRKHAVENITDKKFQTKCFDYIKIINDRKDLSWAELSKMAPNNVIEWGFKAFRNHPLMYEKVLHFRPELEPTILKDERLNSISTGGK